MTFSHYFSDRHKMKEDDVVSRNINTQRKLDWVVVYTTRDEWRARLTQTALLNERINCKIQPLRRPDGSIHRTITVLKSKQIEAMEIVSRVEWAIAADIESRRNELPEESAPDDEGKADVEEQLEDNLPQLNLEGVQQEFITNREGIGEIIHYVDRGYELRAGPQPYYMVDESRWEEFIDFSAQRQEFSILLRGEYPKLFKWLKEEKLMPEFIKLIESTYREVPPPKPRKQKKKKKILNFFTRKT